LNSPVITLTTDFGYEDPFAGVMKGVILTINPEARIIDLTHGIRPHDIREAAFIIGMNYKYFPDGTIHVVVVDPGVGSGRRPVIIETGKHYFVGPDNGIFSMVYNMEPGAYRVINISSEQYFLSSKSPTFQARDVFAPVAAHISRGVGPSDFGGQIEDYTRILLPVPVMVSEDRLKGEVILIDRFGNAITNLSMEEISKLYDSNPEGVLKIFLKGREVLLLGCYSEARDKGIYSLINSSGYLEFFMYMGHVSSENGISIGDNAEIVITGRTGEA